LTVTLSLAKRELAKRANEMSNLIFIGDF